MRQQALTMSSLGAYLLGLAVFGLASAPAAAHAQSAEEEAITVAPRNVPSGPSTISLQIVANDGALFAQTAGRAPSLQVGSGLTVVEFIVESPKMARATVEVAQMAFGAVPVQVLIYGLDGQTVVLLAETSLGVTGPISAGPLTLSVSENRRVIPDEVGLQPAGDIIVEGPISGSYTLDAPLGTSFSATSTPQVVSETSGVTVSDVALVSDESRLTFMITNPENEQTRLRIQGLNLNLATFTANGGERGELAFGLASALLQGQTIPISSAHTPGRTIENPDPSLIDDDPNGGNGDSNEDPENEENNDPPGNENNNTGNNGNNPPANNHIVGGGGGGGTSPPPSSTGANNNNRNNRVGAGGRDQARPGQRTARPNPTNRAQNTRRNVRPATANRQNMRGGAAAAGARGGAAPTRGNVSTTAAGSDQAAARGERIAWPNSGTASQPSRTRSTEGPAAGGRIVDDVAETGGTFQVFRFSLCDERYRPLPALGFQPVNDRDGSSDRLVAHVWLELVVDGDPSPGRVSELTIELAVPGTEPQRVRLYETEPNSGVFRCAPEGIELTLRLDD